MIVRMHILGRFGNGSKHKNGSIFGSGEIIHGVILPAIGITLQVSCTSVRIRN